MSLSERQQIFAENVGKLIAKAFELDIRLTFGEAYRTKSQQYLYYHGQDVAMVDTMNGKQLTLEHAKRRSWTMNSRHLSRMAVDFNFFMNGRLTYDAAKIEPLGRYWESLNKDNVWGGHWKASKDVPHFEMKA